MGQILNVFLFSLILIALGIFTIKYGIERFQKGDYGWGIFYVVLGIIGAVSSAANLIKAFFPKTAGAGKSEPQNDENSNGSNTASEEAAQNGGNKVPSSSTKVVTAPEVKAPNGIKSTDVTDAWDNYLGENTTNINPITGEVDPNRLFSLDGTKSIRFGNHEMASLNTPKGHFHYETWIYDATTDIMMVTNILQRIVA